jgi:membrane protein DedA with SNARE-associated domain
MDLTTLLDAIREHGDVAYGFVFAYAAQNSLLAPLFAGYAAHLGALDWATLVALCWAGGFIGDAIRFWVGRRWGMSLVKRFPKFERGIHVILRLVERHHLWMILIHRYPHGIRGFAGFAFGMSNLSWGLFLVLNFVSAGLWSLIVVSAGYSFGHMSEKALGEAASGIGLALLLAFLGIAWLLSKKLERAIERG